ncbi:hypothetical protein D3C84_201550 [compost metagenome]
MPACNLPQSPTLKLVLENHHSTIFVFLLTASMSRPTTFWVALKISKILLALIACTATMSHLMDPTEKRPMTS